MALLGQQSHDVYRTNYVFTTASGQTTFSCQYNPTTLDVYRNGLHLNPSQYTANTGTSVTIPSAVAGDKIEVIGYSADLKYAVFSNAPILINTSGPIVTGQTYVMTASCTLTLPSNPLPNWTVRIINASNTTTGIIARNGQNIQGMAQDVTIDVLNSTTTLVYIDTTRGWWLI